MELNTFNPIDLKPFYTFFKTNLQAVSPQPELTAFALAYYGAKNIERISYPTAQDFLETTTLQESTKKFVLDLLQDKWHIAEEYCETFSPEACLEYLQAEGKNTYKADFTPDKILELCLNLLHIRKKDTVADFCAGTSGFGVALRNTGCQNSLSVREYNLQNCYLSDLKLNAFGAQYDIQPGDIFSYENDSTQYDKIFCHPVFSMNLRNTADGENFALDELKKALPEFKGHYASDFVFEQQILHQLAPKGKAVMIAMTTMLSNSKDKPFRQYFTEKGEIEAVIDLPANVMNDTNVATSLIILSHNNKKIRMIDASSFATFGRRQHTITDELIQAVLEGIKQDTPISRAVTKKELEANNYSLSPKTYHSTQPELENSVPFASLTKHISRGIAIPKAKLASRISKKPTPYQYLRVSDFKSGYLSTDPENQEFLTDVEKREERYIVPKNALILNKVGLPIKVAVNEIDTPQKIANSNVLFIELNPDVNPWYLKAYLESTQAQEFFAQNCVASPICNLSTETLKLMQIPLPDKETQEQIAEQCKETCYKIEALEAQLSDLNHQKETLCQNILN